MRIWDVEPKLLCQKHLIAEHAELHSIWSILTNQKKGFSHHPETKRWQGKLKALYSRHEQLVKEMKSRKLNHQSTLNKKQAKGKSKQNIFLQTPTERINSLKKKTCQCPLKMC